MFTNKSADGLNNICGAQIAVQRKNLHLSQRQLAEKLQLFGIDVDKNAIQRIESGKRFVTDIELIAFRDIFDIPYEVLLMTEKDRSLPG